MTKNQKGKSNQGMNKKISPLCKDGGVSQISLWGEILKPSNKLQNSSYKVQMKGCTQN